MAYTVMAATGFRRALRRVPHIIHWKALVKAVIFEHRHAYTGSSTVPSAMPTQGRFRAAGHACPLRLSCKTLLCGRYMVFAKHEGPNGDRYNNARSSKKGKMCLDPSTNLVRAAIRVGDQRSAVRAQGLGSSSGCRNQGLDRMRLDASTNLKSSRKRKNSAPAFAAMHRDGTAPHHPLVSAGVVAGGVRPSTY